MIFFFKSVNTNNKHRKTGGARQTQREEQPHRTKQNHTNATAGGKSGGLQQQERKEQTAVYLQVSTEHQSYTRRRRTQIHACVQSRTSRAACVSNVSNVPAKHIHIHLGRGPNVPEMGGPVEECTANKASHSHFRRTDRFTRCSCAFCQDTRASSRKAQRALQRRCKK